MERKRDFLHEKDTPTNGEAARRPYCAKHHRAKIDIGGEKKCPDCMKEKKSDST